MPDCSNSLSVDMLIGLYGSHHINIPTKHFNFQLSIFNFTHSSINTIKHSSNSSFSIFNFSAFALPSLYLRSRFAPMNGPAATPKGPFNGVGYAPRYSYSCYSSIFPKSVIRVTPPLRYAKDGFRTVATVA